MKRKLLIIVIILAIIGLFVGGSWLLARNRAIKSNSIPPTFKEFVGIGVSKKAPNNNSVDNPLSSEFTGEEGEEGNKQDPNGTGTSSSSNNIPIGSSVFTNTGNFNIGQGAGFGLNTGPGSPGYTGSGVLENTGGTGNVGATSPGDNTPIDIRPVGISLPAPECSATDLSINFTPEEIAKLNALKTRFFAVAESLNTDSSVSAEIANYDVFKAKSTKLTELYNYCKNSPVYTQASSTPIQLQSPGTVFAGTNGLINYRVPTPFWRDQNKDNQAFIHQGSNWMGIFTDTDFIFPERSIEHALRLNLW